MRKNTNFLLLVTLALAYLQSMQIYGQESVHPYLSRHFSDLPQQMAWQNKTRTFLNDPSFSKELTFYRWINDPTTWTRQIKNGHITVDEAQYYLRNSGVTGPGIYVNTNPWGTAYYGVHLLTIKIPLDLANNSSIMVKDSNGGLPDAYVIKLHDLVSKSKDKILPLRFAAYSAHDMSNSDLLLLKGRDTKGKLYRYIESILSKRYYIWDCDIDLTKESHTEKAQMYCAEYQKDTPEEYESFYHRKIPWPKEKTHIDTFIAKADESKCNLAEKEEVYKRCYERVIHRTLMTHKGVSDDVYQHIMEDYYSVDSDSDLSDEDDFSSMQSPLKSSGEEMGKRCSPSPLATEEMEKAITAITKPTPEYLKYILSLSSVMAGEVKSELLLPSIKKMQESGQWIPCPHSVVCAQKGGGYPKEMQTLKEEEDVACPFCQLPIDP